MKTFFYIFEPQFRRRNIIFILTALLTFAGACVWMLSTTYNTDDLLYCREVLPDDDNLFWLGYGPMIDDISQIWPSLVNHWILINSRLANFGHIIFQIFPRQLEMVFSAFMLLLMFLGIVAVGQGSRKVPGAAVLALTLVMVWCALPWYDHMQSADYLANYVWTSAVWMAVLWLLPSVPRMRRCRLVAFYVLAVVAGLMHESFTCVVVAFVFFEALMSGRWRSRRYCLLEILLLLTVGLAIMSGLSQRTGHMLRAVSISSLPYLMSRYISASWPVALAVLSVLWCRLRLSRPIWLSERPFFVACIGASIISLIMSMVLGMQGRALWPLSLFSTLAVVRVYSVLFPLRNNDLGRGALILSVVMLVVYALWLTELVRWQRITTAERLDIEAMAASGSNDVLNDFFFYDLTPNEQHPFYLMSITDNKISDINTRRMFSSYIGSDSWGIAVFPTEYRSGAFEDLPAVPGNIGLRGVWPFYVSRDSVSAARISFRAHEFLPQATPIDRALLLALDGTTQPRPRESHTWMHVGHLTFPDGTRGYAYYTGSLQRLVRGRRIEVLSADTIGTEN